MNSLTRDEFESLIEALGHAQSAMNSVAEVLSANYLNTQLGRQLDSAVGEAQNEISNALFAAKLEMKRLKKEASEEQVSP